VKACLCSTPEYTDILFWVDICLVSFLGFVLLNLWVSVDICLSLSPFSKLPLWYLQTYYLHGYPTTTLL
jgi:hypothetical protein